MRPAADAGLAVKTLGTVSAEPGFRIARGGRALVDMDAGAIRELWYGSVENMLAAGRGGEGA